MTLVRNAREDRADFRQDDQTVADLHLLLSKHANGTDADEIRGCIGGFGYASGSCL
jgi:hypothetical protein